VDAAVGSGCPQVGQTSTPELTWEPHLVQNILIPDFAFGFDAVYITPHGLRVDILLLFANGATKSPPTARTRLVSSGIAA